MLGAEVEVERVATLGRLSVVLRAGRRASVSLSSEWGTARADAVTMLEANLNQGPPYGDDQTEDGRRVRNDAETIAARTSSRPCRPFLRCGRSRIGRTASSGATTSCSAGWSCRSTTAAT
ncbi:MAG TPA: hypothetical protein VK988_06525 [Acidimicrobiales bacterium]|nr:hypothetical protein [Acidimicrobiales bacterium]